MLEKMDIFERMKQNPGPLGQFADDGGGYYIFQDQKGLLVPE